MDKFDELANKYVASFGEVALGFKYRFSNRKEFFFKIYYDFIIVDLEGKIPSEPPFAGGACGFTIDIKTYEIEMLTFGEFASLIEAQGNLEKTYNMLSDLKQSDKNLLWLKSTYNLNSVELLKIKKVIMETSFTKQNVIEELNGLVREIVSQD